LTLDGLTEGHPQRRGCKACFQLGSDDCTLIHEAFEYPCTACDDADMECELIVPPKLKKSCERCKRKRISCSYRDDGGNGVDTCKACEYDDEACCAAPLKESAYTKRFTNVISSTTDLAPGRMFTACCQCREAGLRCSLKRDQLGPCKICRENGDKCTFVLESNSNAVAQYSKAQQPQKSQKSKKASKKDRPKRALTPSVQHATDSLATPGRAWEILGEDAEKEFKKSSRGKERGKRNASTLISSLNNCYNFRNPTQINQNLLRAPHQVQLYPRPSRSTPLLLVQLSLFRPLGLRRDHSRSHTLGRRAW